MRLGTQIALAALAASVFFGAMWLVYDDYQDNLAHFVAERAQDTAFWAQNCRTPELVQAHRTQAECERREHLLHINPQMEAVKMVFRGTLLSVWRDLFGESYLQAFLASALLFFWVLLLMAGWIFRNWAAERARLLIPVHNKKVV